MQKSTNLLKPFNSYTFTSAAQSVLSSLCQQELQNLLVAIQHIEEYSQLAQLCRSRIFICITERVDRTYYYTHYQNMSLTVMREQRGNRIAQICDKQFLGNMLLNYKGIIRKGRKMFQQQFQEIEMSIFEPTLPLPPMVRQTTAPECKTVYQVTLASINLGSQMEQESIFAQDEETIQYFFQCLKMQVEMSNVYLTSLTEQYEHFAELTYRFMVYKNSVLSLNQLCPFPVLSDTMKLWNSHMHHHYVRSNKVFVNLIGLGVQQKLTGDGLLSGEQLKEQGYLVDYVQGLVDQSIVEADVAFCGHSKQTFGGEYAILEKELFLELGNSFQSIRCMGLQAIKRMLLTLSEYGLKPSTLAKICASFDQLQQCQGWRQDICCRSDAFIENCARINGSQNTDIIDFNLMCF